MAEIDQDSGLELFYESYRAALRKDAVVVGGGKKNWAIVVGPKIFPEKDPEAASRTLMDCTNPNRRERLSDEQEHWIMREANRVRGYSHALAHICDTSHFERPKPREVKEEQARLISVIENATNTLRAALGTLTEIRNSEPPASASVTPIRIGDGN